MKIKLIMCLWIVLLTVSTVLAKDTETKVKGDTKVLSGMSIVGNDETPKALYIVPWKSSELADEASLNLAVNRGYAPVDREEFRRTLDYYYFRTTSHTGR